MGSNPVGYELGINMKNLKLATDLLSLCDSIYSRLSRANNVLVKFHNPYLTWDKGADQPKIICDVVFGRDITEKIRQNIIDEANNILDGYKRFYKYIYLEEIKK